MANRRMLPDKITLYNYVGEEGYNAVFQETVISHCYCPVTLGASEAGAERSPTDSADLFIFDFASEATDSEGNKVQYLPCDQWEALPDKAGYWTLREDSKDYFVKDGHSSKLKVTKFCHLVAGSKRMWHFEVKGE